MSRISAMMDIGKRSMMNSQTSLQTTSHNIANKSTEGYSRQRTESVTNTPVGQGKVRIGMGSRAAAVQRVNNPHLEKQLVKEGANLGYSEARAQSLQQVEEVYNEQINKGLNKHMGEFFNAFRELSATPESLANRTLVRETSVSLAKDFGRVSGQLKTIQEDIDTQVKANLIEINAMAEEIGVLNQKVQSAEIGGAAANDERDRRDLLLKKLSEKIDIRWAEGDSGMVTVSTAGSAVLVSGYENFELKATHVATPQRRQADQMRVFYETAEGYKPIDITDQIKGGTVGAVLEVRDKEIEGLLDQVDEMALVFGQRVNGIHKQGYNKYSEQGMDFFKFERGAFDAASGIQVNKEIIADVSRIATAATPNAPGDNRVANMIADLQYKNTMRGGKSSFDQFYNGIVGQVGVNSSQAQNRADAQQGIVKQLKNLRESVSGVSLDEETAKMIEFQKTFDASARLITTAEEMLDTVLSLKR